MKTTIFRQFLVVFLVLILSIVYFNCDDSGVVTKKIDLTPISCISGKIVNWTRGIKTLNFNIFSVTNHSYSVASCPIDSQGNFNMCLPSSVQDTALFFADSVFYSSCPGNGVVSPSDAKGVQMLDMEIVDTTTAIGFLRLENADTLFSGYFTGIFIYVNKDITVSGVKYCNNDSLTFNGAAVTGWNMITKHYTKFSGLSGNNILFDNDQPAGAHWKFYGIY